jgi:riboflavin transporter FmnP
MMMAIVVQILKQPISALVDMTRLWGIFIQGFGAGIVGILVYTLLTWLLGVEEIPAIRNSLTRRWLTLSSVEASVNEPDEL